MEGLCARSRYYIELDEGCGLLEMEGPSDIGYPVPANAFEGILVISHPLLTALTAFDVLCELLKPCSPDILLVFRS